MTPLAVLQHVIVWLPLVIGGILLIRAGLKGRRINDHPICRRCRFDLVGLGALSHPATPDTAPESGATKEKVIGSESRSTQSHPDRCPECGTDLTGTTRRARRAVIDGERRRRWRFIVLGVVLLLAGLGIGFWLSYKPLAKFPWTSWMPDWVLAEMVDSPNPGRASMARREIQQRIRLQSFSRSAAQRLAGDILQWQAQRSRPWKNSDGALLELFHGSRLITSEQWTMYARQSLRLSLVTRTCVEGGQSISWALTHKARLGSAARHTSTSANSPAYEAPIYLRVEPLRVTIGESEFAAAPEATSVTISVLDRRRAILMSGDVQHQELRPGRHSGTLDVRVSALDDPDPRRPPQDSQPPIVSWIERVPFTFTLLPRGVSCVTPISDPLLRAEIVRAFVYEITSQRSELGEPILVGHGYGNLPIAIAFEVQGNIIHADGTIQPLTFLPILADEGDPLPTLRSSPLPAQITNARINLRLRPSPEIARGHIHRTEIWGEEIILENVPITNIDE
ncbi:MAG: hypothetical protein KIT19_14350 [Phycisphaeraceae bacterium]|nr:hypothetical protein [Phycisphaeraceae bacterium]